MHAGLPSGGGAGMVPAPCRNDCEREKDQEDQSDRDPGEQPRHLVHADTAAGQDQEEDAPGKASHDALHGSRRVA